MTAENEKRMSETNESEGMGGIRSEDASGELREKEAAN